MISVTLHRSPNNIGYDNYDELNLICTETMHSFIL